MGHPPKFLKQGNQAPIINRDPQIHVRVAKTLAAMAFIPSMDSPILGHVPNRDRGWGVGLPLLRLNGTGCKQIKPLSSVGCGNG